MLWTPIVILLFLYSPHALHAQDVERTGDTVFIQFRPGSTRLTPSAKKQLDRLAKLLKRDVWLGVKAISSTRGL